MPNRHKIEIGIGVMLAFGALIWPDLAPWAAWTGFLGGVGLVSWGAIGTFRDKSKKPTFDGKTRKEPTIQNIPAADSANPQEVDHQDLRPLNNLELRTMALNFANQMRVFEANYQRNSVSMKSHELPLSATEAQKSAAWQKDRKIDKERRAAHGVEFATRIRPEAAAIRHEIARRLGIYPPYEDRSTALDDGMLAGINPITEAADLIDELARKLP